MKLLDKKILIVEDDDIARGVLELILRKYFTDVYSAPNGRDGLEMYEKIRPDLIVADLAMPVLDGFLMLKHLEEKYQEAPVLIVTAYREEAKQCGDYEVLHKPIDRKELLGAIGSLLKIEVPF